MLYQVNRLLPKGYVFSQILRHIHSDTIQIKKSLHPLENRKLLRVFGEEASVFLQGLITNDMRHFEDGAKSIYSMLLNNKGRVLYDTLIHKWENENTFLMECDSKTITLLIKHLKLYKLKRKIQIDDISDKYNVYALINVKIAASDLEVDANRELNIYKDPRLTELGYRIVASTKLKGDDISKSIGEDIDIKYNEDEYKYLRYQLGVSEGAEDLPPGSSFPLEANCDYLHGVSFHKGCYIGQELTARVHHTGVVRKRIMPLKFTETVKDILEKDAVISDVNKEKSNLGKLKGFILNYGVGLMRVKESLEAKKLIVGKYEVEPIKPAWWPVEAPKEKLNLKSESTTPEQ